jgi:SNF2 family DNA or RNA helicase
LVCCPASVIPVWGHEARKHKPDSFKIIILELSSEKGKNTCAQRKDFMEAALKRAKDHKLPIICVINYDAVIREPLKAYLAKTEWDMIVCDESHRIKSRASKINTFLRDTMRERTQKRVGLTGTPLAEGPIDVFGQMLFIEPAIYGEFITKFKAEYCVMGGFQNKQILNYRNMEEFTQRMNRITLRVEIDDVMDLPPISDQPRYVELDVATRKVYDSLKRDFISEYKDGVIVGANILTRLLRLQQITSGYCAIEDPTTEERREVELGSEKADALREILEDLPHTEPVVVFCRFTHDIMRVFQMAFLTKRVAYQLTGKSHDLDLWNSACANGKGAVLAVQIQAGGLGVDVTASHYCVYYSLGFSLGQYEQSRARMRRPGQKHKMIYFHLMARKTVDELVYQALQKKNDQVKDLCNALTNPVFESE